MLTVSKPKLMLSQTILRRSKMLSQTFLRRSDADYLAFFEAYESGQGPPSGAATAAAVAEPPPAGAGATGAENSEGKVVNSRLMEYLVRKYAEGGNRLGGMRAASKAKQSKQDLIQLIQERGTAGPKATKAAAAAAAAAATAALSSVATSEIVVTKTSRRERERLAKGAAADVSGKVVASRGAGKGAPPPSAEAALDATMHQAVNLLTRGAGVNAVAVKAVSRETAAEQQPHSGSSSSRAEGGAAQRMTSRAAVTEVDGASLGIARGSGASGRSTAAAQQSAARGTSSAAQEEPPDLPRPPATGVPRLLLVKGGSARLTQVSLINATPYVCLL